MFFFKEEQQKQNLGGCFKKLGELLGIFVWMDVMVVWWYFLVVFDNSNMEVFCFFSVVLCEEPKCWHMLAMYHFQCM